MLTEIVSPETMPKNNRKTPKGQRFVIEVLGMGQRGSELDYEVNFVTRGRSVLQGLALCQYLGRK
jgi:hypothetical protein